MAWVLVETVSMYRMRYMVEIRDEDPIDYALDTVVCNQAKEFSQKHIDESIITQRHVTIEEALRICDEDNDYVKNWDKEKKIEVFFTKLEDIENAY